MTHTTSGAPVDLRGTLCEILGRELQSSNEDVQYTFAKENKRELECLPFDRKIWLECRKHNGIKRFTSLPQNGHIRYGLNKVLYGFDASYMM